MEGKEVTRVAGRACGARVHWTHLRCEGSEGKVLKMDGPSAQGFLSLTALRAEGCGIALTDDKYKVSVTGFTFSVIWYDKHSADWLAALASPYPAAPDFPLFRGQNKALKSSPFISSSQHNGAL